MSWNNNSAEIQGFNRGVTEVLNDLSEAINESHPQTVEEVQEIIDELRRTYVGNDPE